MRGLDTVSGVAAEIAQVAARLRRSLVLVRGHAQGSGSGVAWRQSGIILTNDHVVHGPRARVSLADGRTLDAEVIGRDSGLDLAALRVSDTLTPAPIGDSRGLRVGQLVIAVGNPLGVAGAATLGIISVLGRAGRGGREFVEADIDVYPGNSGGPLADAEGRVVGLTTMILSPGIALAVPAHVADTALARFLGEAPRRERLGVKGWMVPLPQPWVERVGQPNGLMLGEVLPDSLAAQAGLLVGDIIIGMGGEPILDAEALQRLLNGSNDSFQLRILRGGVVRDLTTL